MARCPYCGGNLSEISSKFSRCDGCGKIWWNNNPAISAEKPSEKTVSSSPVRGGAGAGSAPAKEASEEKREAKVEKISGRKASDSKSAEQREIEELRARLQAMEERTAAQERSRYDTKAKRDKASFKNTPAYEVARKWGLKVILPIFLILIALITLLSCFCGLRGIYVNIDNPNEFYSFTATKYEYHGTLFGEEYVDKGTWKKSDGKLELTYKDEFFGKITDSYEFSIKDSYKIITVTDDFGIEREYKRVSLMAYSTPQKVTVKFHINDGSNNADKKRVDLGARVAEPEAPVRNGYEFMGWYTDKEGWRNGEGEQFSENDRVWEKTEYYANWKSTAEYSLTGDFIKETLKFKEGADLKALYAANVTNELLKGEWEIIFVQEANEDNVVDGSLAPAANVVARLVSVVIPDSVTSIGDYAFYKCKGLTSVTIPDSVTSIGDYAFDGCTGLTSVYYTGDIADWCGILFEHQYANPLYYAGKLYIDGQIVEDLVIPDSVTEIKAYAFSGCTGLTSVTIPDSVTSIRDGAFYGCSGLTSVSIPDGVTSIEYWAFIDCTGLTSITIPDSVTSIGTNAFSNCTGLTEINWNAVSVADFNSDYVFSNAGTAGEGIAVTFGDSVQKIPAYAFEHCTGLTSVTIGDSVTSIGNSAFRDCTGLTSVTIPDSVTSIGESAFSGCTNLIQKENGVSYVDKWVIDCDSVGKVTLRSDTVGIGDDAFSGCTGLTSVIIPDSVTSIRDRAFYNCSGLTSVTIGEGVTSIGVSAFSGCTGLTSVTIGEGVTSIGSYAFYNCTGLKSIYYTGDIAGWCGISGLDEVMPGGRTLYIDGSKVEGAIAVPDGVTSIPSYAFAYQTGITSVTIPNSVTSIGSSAFSGCSGLESITIPFVGAEAGKTSGDTYQYPFGYIFGTTSYTGGTEVKQYYYGSSTSRATNSTYYIPSSLREVTVTGGNILYGAFYDCSGLTSVTIGDGVKSIGSAAFYNCTNLIQIENGVNYVDKWVIDCSDLVSEVTLRSDTVGIGSAAFEDCTGLTSVTIPDSVTSIGGAAFWGCTGLTSVIIPDSVTSIGGSAFRNCKGLTSVIIPDSVTSIGNYAFYNCTRLTSVTIGNSVTSIGESAFEDCTGLTSVTIPDSVKSIGNYAFYNCTNLIQEENGVSYVDKWVIGCYSSVSEVTLRSDTVGIGNSAFWGCTGLTSVTIPDSVTSIGNNAFTYCTGLTSVTIGNSVTSIGWSAFSRCTGLSSVVFEDTEGWQVSEDSYFDRDTSLSSADLANTSTAAKYLRSTYDNYFWRKVK